MPNFFTGQSPLPKAPTLLDSMGISNLKLINKFGYNSEIDTATDPEDVWSYGGIYTFITSPIPLFISSSDNTDTQIITVSGLDENWLTQTQTVTLAGQTKTPIAGTWMRIDRLLIPTLLSLQEEYISMRIQLLLQEFLRLLL